MKVKLLYLLIFAFAKAYTSQAQVYSDKVNAPLNPLGMYGGLYENQLLKGNVYYADFKWYDKNKQLIGERALPSEWNSKSTNDKYIKTKNGLIVEYGSPKSQIIYEYDAKKRIVSEKYSNNTYTYSYDIQGRIVKKENFLNGKTISITTFKYTTQGDLLTVSAEETIASTVYKLAYTYKNGLNLSFTNDGKTTNYTYTFDNIGNWVTKTFIGTSGKEITEVREIIYWSDIEPILNGTSLDWKSVSSLTRQSVYFPYPYLKGKVIEKGILTVRGISNDGIFYTPVGNKYFFSSGAYSNDNTNTGKGQAQLISEGNEAIFQEKDSKALLIDYGKVVSGLHNRLGNDYYIADTVNKIHYIAKNFNQSKNSFTPVKKYYGDLAFYGVDRETNKYFIFYKGSTVNYSEATLATTDSGETVLIYENKPVFILTGYNTAPHRELLPTRPYNGENLKESEEAFKFAFNPDLPLYIKKETATSSSFYQQDKGIVFPTVWGRAAKQEDFVMNYGDNSYVVLDYDNVKVGDKKLAIKITSSSPIIAHYLDGTLAYFYSNSLALKTNERINSTISDNKMLVYFPKWNKSALLDFKKASAPNYVGVDLIESNDFLKITDTGAIALYTNGKFIPFEDYKFYIDDAGNAHIYMNEKPLLYLAGFDSKAKPSIQVLEKHSGQTYVKAATSGNVNSSLSANAKKVLAAHKSANAFQETKTILQEMDNAHKAKGMTDTLRAEMFAILFKELYPVDKEVAFQVSMRMPREINVLQFIQALPSEQRDFVKARARQTISSVSTKQ